MTEACTQTLDPDHLTAEGAKALSKRIEAYWRERGFAVTCTTNTQAPWDAKDRGNISGVRSNLINGWPRRHGS